MNNAKLWLVVKPTVGVPLFLGAVAVGSFAVHVAVLSNTTWVADFLSGKSAGGMAAASLVLPQQDAAKASYSASAGQEVLITMPDGTTAVAILKRPDILASN